MIVGTGRSDFPNQINNALVFPGIFRGLLDGKVKRVTAKVKIMTAEAVAKSVVPKEDKILPMSLSLGGSVIVDKGIKTKNINPILMKMDLLMEWKN